MKSGQYSLLGKILWRVYVRSLASIWRVAIPSQRMIRAVLAKSLKPTVPPSLTRIYTSHSFVSAAAVSFAVLALGAIVGIGSNEWISTTYPRTDGTTAPGQSQSNSISPVRVNLGLFQVCYLYLPSSGPSQSKCALATSIVRKLGNS